MNRFNESLDEAVDCCLCGWRNWFGRNVVQVIFRGQPQQVDHNLLLAQRLKNAIANGHR